MYPVSQRFRDALLYSHQPTSRIEVWSGLTGTYLGNLPFTDAAVTIDVNNEIRRQLSVTLTDTDSTLVPADASALLAPYGNELRPYRGIRYADGTEEVVPLGAFPLIENDSQWDGKSLPITLVADDRSSLVTAALLTDWVTIAAGTNIADAIETLLSARVAGLTFNLEPTTFTTGLIALAPGDDPWKVAREQLAAAAGQDLFFDADGAVRSLTVPDPDTTAESFDYTEGALNIVTQASRKQTVLGAFNVVVVIGQGPDVASPVRAVAQDNDPTSPTFVGGKIGQRVRVIKTDQASTLAQAQAIADAELRKTLGATSQVAFTGVVNPATAGSDVITIDQTAVRASGRYIIDTAAIPLRWDQLMQITTRARTAA